MGFESEYHSSLPPLTAEAYLDRPTALREELEAHNALRFVPFSSGLFPASDLPPLLGQKTGMGNNAWFRDGAHIAMALYANGHADVARNYVQATLQFLHESEAILDSSAERLPVRVDGITLRPDTEERIQNDSVGYMLWPIGQLMRDGIIPSTQKDRGIIAKTVQYLDRVNYWRDSDHGHWEEDCRIHASSIGVAFAGMQSVQSLFGPQEQHHIAELIAKGRKTMYTILGQGLTDISGSTMQDVRGLDIDEWSAYLNARTAGKSEFDIHIRRYDAATLFMIEPLGILHGPWAEKIVTDIEQHLIREKGIARYIGDTYWSPGFKELLTIEERTSAAEGRLDLRNVTASKVAATKTEAQWTLFDPILSVYWGKRYVAEGEPLYRQKQLFYLNRSLGQLCLQEDGSLKIPELFYHEHEGANLDDSFAQMQNFRLVPGDHTPLLWSQANLLNALRIFEQTSL